MFWNKWSHNIANAVSTGPALSTATTISTPAASADATSTTSTTSAILNAAFSSYAQL